jgi:hypothetical protein
MTPPDENHHTFAMPSSPYPAGTGEDAPVEVRKIRAPRPRAGSRHSAAPGAINAVAFAELLIDREEDRTFRPVLVGMLREADRSSPG